MPETIEVTTEPASLTLLPGESGEIKATIKNLGQTVDQMLLSVEGVDPAWYTIPVSSVALFPNDQDNLKVTVHPPKSAESQQVTFKVAVTSQENAEAVATSDVTVEIKALLEVELTVTPESITGRKGTFQVVLNNPADHATSINLFAQDRQNRLRYNFQLSQLTLDPQGEAQTTLEVKPGWLAFLGGEKPFEFKVSALPPGEITAPAFCPYCGKRLKQKPGAVHIFCPGCEQKLNEKAKWARAEFVREPLIKGLPRIRFPWFSRKPLIRKFRTSTEDKREFKLEWETKRAREVRLGDEVVENVGEMLVHPTEPARYTLVASNQRSSISQTIEVQPLPVPKHASERIRATLSPPSVQVTAGVVPAMASLQLQNLGEIVDKFMVEIVGLDHDWYNRSASSVALMPQATDQVQLTFQPPKKEGVREGKYPFAVVVRSESVPDDVMSVLGELEVVPAPEFKLQVRPVRVTCRRKGRFRVGLENTGVSDIDIGFEVTDLEEGCRFKFENDALTLPAWRKLEIPMITRPKRGWFVGEMKLYNITVTALGSDITNMANCDLTHKPLFKSWRSLFRLIRAIAVIAVVIVAVYLAIHWGGGWDALLDDPGQWADDLVNGTYAPW
ncbi:MAG: hypothetical protein R6U37_04120 [Dehalococcoidia bacterium]